MIKRLETDAVIISFKGRRWVFKMTQQTVLTFIQAQAVVYMLHFFSKGRKRFSMYVLSLAKMPYMLESKVSLIIYNDKAVCNCNELSRETGLICFRQEDYH